MSPPASATSTPLPVINDPRTTTDRPVTTIHPTGRSLPAALKVPAATIPLPATTTTQSAGTTPLATPNPPLTRTQPAVPLATAYPHLVSFVLQLAVAWLNCLALSLRPEAARDMCAAIDTTRSAITRRPSR